MPLEVNNDTTKKTTVFAFLHFWCIQWTALDVSSHCPAIAPSVDMHLQVELTKLVD